MASKKLQIVGWFNLPQPDWSQTDPTKPDYIKNKPSVIGGVDANITISGDTLVVQASHGQQVVVDGETLVLS